MLHFTIYLLFSSLLQAGMSLNDDSPGRKENIIKDIISALNNQIENIAKEVDEYANIYKNSYLRYKQQQYRIGRKISGQIQHWNSHCGAMKITFDLITTHIERVVQECYNRAKTIVDMLLFDVNKFRNRVKEEISKWATKVSYKIGFISPLFVPRYLLEEVTNNETISRFEFIKNALESSQIYKILKETEFNVSLRFCGVMENSLKESTTILTELKECLFQQGTEETSEAPNNTTVEPTI